MEKTLRKDLWKPEEDKVLGDKVIEVVSNGGTQLKAFQQVADIVGRTASAVGFRWNAEVRKQYMKELSEAKRSGRKSKPKTHIEEIAKLSIKRDENRVIIVNEEKSEFPEEKEPVQQKQETDHELENFISKYKLTIEERNKLHYKVLKLEKQINQLEIPILKLKKELGLRDEEDLETLIGVIKHLRSIFVQQTKEKV
ncbi:hypothetical protein U8V72_11730 [Priestia filamentosa]|uniref:hypothetical protein n=1 Tax=Priestia filamentosa TaxID=1402861 RepID=UPI0039799F13